MDGMAGLFSEDDVFDSVSVRPGSAAQARILYVEDFDAPPPPPAREEAAPEVMPPLFTLEDYTAACEAARAAGVQEGRDEALQESAVLHAQLRAAALAAIGDALAMGADARAAVAAAMEEELAQTMLCMLVAALPACCDSTASREIAALLRAVLPPLRREPELLVQVHPNLLDTVAADLAPFQAQFGGRLNLGANAALAVPDVFVRWQDGEARRDVGALQTALQRALSPLADGDTHGG